MDIASVTIGSRFQRNILRIASGTVLSQVIVIAAMPVLSRIYRPEDFGALAVFTSVHVIIAAFATLKYELAIILPPDSSKAWQLTALTLASSSLISAVLLVGLCLASAAGWLGDWFYLLLPLGAILVAATACGQQWNARSGDYRRYAHSQILNSLINVCMAFGLITLANVATGELIIAYLMGLTVSTIYLTWGLGRAFRGRSGEPITPHSLLVTASEYRRFPLMVLPTSLVGMIGTSAVPFILQSMFSLREVGFFAIASRLLLAPGILVGNAVSEAFRSEFVNRMRDGSIAPFFRSTFFKLAAFAVPTFALVFVLAPVLFAIVFGAEYRESGILARYLCLGVFGQFLAQPFTYVFVATNHVRSGLVVQGLTSIAPLAGLLFGGIKSDMHLALLLYSIAALVCSAVQVSVAHRCCRQHDRMNRSRGGQ